MIDGKVHWFGVPGIANGLALMRDEESNSLWDHITGECFEGSLNGERLDFWPVHLTTVLAERTQNPNTILLKSDYRSIKVTMMRRVLIGFGKDKGIIKNKGTLILPHFRKSMHSDVDPRLPEGEQGLGIIDAQDNGKFYPMRLLPKGEAIKDSWQGRLLHIERGILDGVPFAIWADTGEPPMQLLSRWYGFAFTYPHCDIYEGVPIST